MWCLSQAFGTILYTSLYVSQGSPVDLFSSILFLLLDDERSVLPRLYQHLAPIFTGYWVHGPGLERGVPWRAVVQIPLLQPSKSSLSADLIQICNFFGLDFSSYLCRTSSYLCWGFRHVFHMLHIATTAQWAFKGVILSKFMRCCCRGTPGNRWKWWMNWIWSDKTAEFRPYVLYTHFTQFFHMLTYYILTIGATYQLDPDT